MTRILIKAEYLQYRGLTNGHSSATIGAQDSRRALRRVVLIGPPPRSVRERPVPALGGGPFEHQAAWASHGSQAG